MAFTIEGTAKPRTPGIIDQLAAEHKVQPAAVEAVIEVESAGKPFSKSRPTILPERHKVYALLPAAKRAQAVKLGLARAKRSRSQYADMKSQDARWQFLSRVADFAGEETACRCASWGGPQIMGFNHRMSGFDSALDMARAFAGSEDAQVAAMMRFIAAAGLMDELRALDWVGFARGYNGAGYAANHYDVKLEVQYARFSSGFTPNIEMRTAQAALLVLGHSPGKIDGVIGRRTRDALRNFQIASGLPITTELTPEAYQALYRAAFS